jgi:hypothetical protein
MAFQLPTQPNYNVAPPQMPSPLEQYGKMLQLRMLSGEAQMQPLRMAEAQQDIQAKTLENQKSEIDLKTRQARNTYWSNPQQFQTSAPEGGDQFARMLGVADDDPILGMVRGQMKAGVPGDAAIADAKATLEFRRSVGQATQEQQKVLDDSHAKLQQLAAPILAESDPTKKAALIEQVRPGLAEWASFDPSIKPIIPQLTAQNFDAFANLLGANQPALELRAKAADLWKKELENAETANPLLKMRTNPTEAFSGDKLPASIAYLTTKAKDPDPIVATLATQLLGVANSSKNVELSMDRAKKEAAQAIQDGDPKAAAKLLIDGTVAPSQIISARKPEFAQKAFTAASQLAPGWDARKAEADFKVASSPANVQYFGSIKSLTDKGGMLDQLEAAGKDIPQNEFKPFNTIADAYKASIGSGPMAKYATIAVGVADDYAKVQGGGVGTDTSRIQTYNLIGAKLTPEERKAAVEGIRAASLSSRDGRIGSNEVLRKMYGQNLAKPSDQMIRARDPQGKLHEAPAGTPLPQGWKLE